MEIWDVYDADRRKTGRLHERGVAMAPGDYHLVVHVWIVGRDGRVLLSRRDPAKPYGGLWECTGGSVVAGEDSLTGAVREVEEELGVALPPERGTLARSVREEDSFCDVWLFRHDADLHRVVCQPGEVIDVRWATPSELAALLAAGDLVPTLAYYPEIELWASPPVD